MIARELETIVRRQQQLEATNERLQEKAVDIRRSLKDLDLTESQYLELRLVNEDDLALKDFVAVCLLFIIIYLFISSNNNRVETLQ
jgi:progesterone-induced-blocking factor 1